MEIFNNLNAAKSKLDVIPSTEYQRYANLVDVYIDLKHKVKTLFGYEMASNALLKMQELMVRMNLLDNIEYFLGIEREKYRSNFKYFINREDYSLYEKINYTISFTQFYCVCSK